MCKNILKIITFLISLILIVDMFFCCSMTVYAFPVRLKDGTWIDKPWSEAAEEIWLTIQYGLSQIGVFFVNGADFKQWLKNTEAYQDLWDENGRLAKNISIDTKTGNVTYSKEIMTVLKSAADEYAKENESYYLVPVPSYLDVTPSQFATKAQYTTICNLAKTYGLIGVNGRFISNLSDVREKNHVFVWSPYYNNISENPDWSTKDIAGTYIYDQEWQRKIYTFYSFSFTSDVTAGYTSFDDGLISTDDNTTSIKKHDTFIPNYTMCNNGRVFNNTYGQSYAMTASLVSKDRCRVRVYKTLEDFKKYSVGSRKVYYTSNYYNYVPEDLSVSIDDLEKSVDDLQKVIDELLKQIQDNTDEKEIEDLLRQILEEIRNGQGTGGGGTGGGDVNVDIDLSTTNGLLSNILAKVTQIFDRISETAEGVSDSVHAKMQETLDEMLVQIKKLKHWTMADTAVNAAGAVADWLDFLKGIFDDMENGAGTAVAAVSSSLEGASGLLKTKFPFCIPWDVAFLVTFLAHEPETPVFKLPLHIESVGIDEYIEVDMSEFSGISTISRTILMLIYCYGLLNLTMKIIPVAKEGT